MTTSLGLQTLFSSGRTPLYEAIHTWVSPSSTRSPGKGLRRGGSLSYSPHGKEGS